MLTDVSTQNQEDPAVMLALRAEVDQYYKWLGQLKRKGLWDSKTQFAPDPYEMHTGKWD